MKDYDKKYFVPGLDYEYPTESGICEDGVGMTERAHEIVNSARGLSSVIHTLRAVNMDRMADNVEFVQQRILMLAREIPTIVNKELDASIAHGQQMMGGLLSVAMKMGDQAGEIERLKKKRA